MEIKKIKPAIRDPRYYYNNLKRCLLGAISRSLTRKTKNRGNYVLYKRFGRYYFYILCFFLKKKLPLIVGSRQKSTSPVTVWMPWPWPCYLTAWKKIKKPSNCTMSTSNRHYSELLQFFNPHTLLRSGSEWPFDQA